MTGDEMQRAIEFILESEARLNARMEELTQAQKQFAEEAASDRQDLRDAVARIEQTADADRREFREGIERIERAAEADRAEIRAAVNTMLSFAEAMADNVTLLTQTQQGTTQRVGRLEDRVDMLERSE